MLLPRGWNSSLSSTEMGPKKSGIIYSHTTIHFMEEFLSFEKRMNNYKYSCISIFLSVCICMYFKDYVLNCLWMTNLVSLHIGKYLLHSCKSLLFLLFKTNHKSLKV